MDELIQKIVATTGIDEGMARSAVRIILSFLYKEGPSDKVKALMSNIDGGMDYIGEDEDDGADLAGGLGSLMGGGAMAVLTELQGIGLDMGQIQGVTQETVSFAKEKGGQELTDEIVGSIPGLDQFV